jgi:segregation and condensation protein A
VSETPEQGNPRAVTEDGRRFHLPVFEGPLDLLLHLVKRNELDPQEVTASIITEQYLQYLELMESLNLDVAGEYLVMAATLLLIKSFSLLPNPEMAAEDEGEELKRDLIARLMEYQRYREAAAKLAERPMLGRDVFTSPGEKTDEPSSRDQPYKVSLFDLIEALREVLKRLADQKPREIQLRDIAVADCIPIILRSIEQLQRVEFSALFSDISDRSLVVATFLALLELIRRGNVRVFQEVRFGPIFLSRGDREFSNPQQESVEEK